MSLRLRLTFAFALAMAVVLAAVGFFVYARLADDLRQAVDQGLRTHAGAVVALVRPANAGIVDSLGRTADPDAGFAQVLDRRGEVIDETGGADLDREPLLTPDQLRHVHDGSSFFEGTVGDDSVRLLAVPMRTRDSRPLVVVAGTSLEDSQQALAGLRHELLIGGPIALLLASLLGYTLSAAALRPVERMRRRAAEISTSEPGQRLPVPGGRSDEIARLGRTLNEMLERLELSLERERGFVADASHELRTPLALLKTEIELALDEPHSAAELREALRSAGEETDRLTQLAEDLLLLAGVEKDAIAIHPEPLELDELLATVALRFERRAAESGRRIEVAQTGGATAAGDRLRLEQALGNLVENSLRHGAGTVELTARLVAGGVELHVGDHGAGFPPVFLDHAFERFSRADEARGRGGTGLGLAIVAAVARSHGGEAHARNRKGGGADVWLFLPQPSPASNGTPQPSARHRSGTLTGTSRRTAGALDAAEVSGPPQVCHQSVILTGLGSAMMTCTPTSISSGSGWAHRLLARGHRLPGVLAAWLRDHPVRRMSSLPACRPSARLAGRRGSRVRFAALGVAVLLAAGSLFAFRGPARTLAGAISLLTTARPVWVWLAAAAFVTALVFSAATWRFALRACGARIGPIEACARYGVGSLVNSFLPARAGDATRIALFAQTLPGEGRLLSAAGVALSIAALRALVFCVPLTVAVAAGTLPLVPVLALAGAFAAATAVAVVLARRNGRGRRLGQLLAAVRMLATSPRHSIRLLGWVAAAAVARLAAAAAIAAAFGVHAPVSAALISIPAVALATVVPLTPANLGVTSAAVALSLHSRGVGLSEAIACGIAFHAVETAVGILFGAAGGLMLHWRRRPVRRRWQPIAAGALGAALLAGAVLGTGLT